MSRSRWYVAVGGLLIAAGAVWGAWGRFAPQSMGDYPGEFWGAMHALLGGHPVAMFARLPPEGAGGSVLLTAPAGLIAAASGAGLPGTFHAVALACILVAGALGVWLAAEAERRGASRMAGVAVIAVFVLASTLLDAVRFGHPEETLGAVLCIAAVLLAGAGRPGLAGLALGLALINKPWAILAVPPTVLAARDGRVRLLVTAGVCAGAWNGAFYLLGHSAFENTLRFASSPVVAHPVDLWWPLARLRVEPGVMPAYLPPGWVSHHGRELAAVLAVLLAVPLARRRERTVEQCLALLALLLLSRCLFDPEDHIYYQLPFVLALAAWEARHGRPPVLALVALGGFFVIFHTISGVASLDTQFAAYMLLTVPLAVWIGRPALGIGNVSWRDRHRRGAVLPGRLA